MRIGITLAGLAIATLSGCAALAPDSGFDAVEKITRERIGRDLKWVQSETDRAAVDSRVAELLKAPLTADDAVQIALLNNQGLQAAFYELSIADSERAQAGRLPNPRLTLLRLRNGDDYKIEQTLTFNIFSWVTLPLASQLEQRRFARVQQQVAQEVLQRAAEARRAWFLAVAAEETVNYMQQVKTAADASRDLAARMREAGNWSRLAEARQQSFFADAAINLARAEEGKQASREKLLRLLGVVDAATLKLPTRLPDLPDKPDALPDLEKTALTNRLDIQAARRDLEALAKNMGLSRATRFINALEFGPARELEGERSTPYKTGYELSLEIPLFDWGTAKVAKAEALYLQAVSRAAEIGINARSEVRAAHQAYLSRYGIVLHYRDEIVPLKKRIAAESLLRYNGMLSGSFDVLADARAQIVAVSNYVDALRDFWLAQIELDRALIGRPAEVSTMMAPAMMSDTSAAAAH
ncbi:MAG: TolC family protein [Betaproteobacteria bacterium]|nr:TolC family protein [Betaproteobacteria bacterium]